MINGAPVVDRARLAEVGGADDERPLVEVLDELDQLIAPALAALATKDREGRQGEAWQEIERLRLRVADGDDAAAPALARAAEEARRVAGLASVREPPHSADRVMERVGRAQIHVPTGLPSWDASTRGGLLAGHLHVLAGGPDAGKTGVALQAALAAAATRTISVVWLAYDEVREDVEHRIGQAHGLSLDDLELGREGALRGLQSILRGLPELLILEGGEGYTIEDALDVALARRRRLGLASVLLVVDSLQTARCRGHAGRDAPRSQLERLDLMVGALRETARRGPCVLATSETARSTHARKGREQTPAIAAGKGSSSIEFWALTQWRLSRIARGEFAGDVALEPGKNKRGAPEWRRVSIRLERDQDRCTYADRGPLDAELTADEAKAPAPKPAEVTDRSLDRVRAELLKHPRGVAGGVEGLVALVGGKALVTRKAVRQLQTAGEIDRRGDRLFHHDQVPTEATKAPEATGAEIRDLVLGWVRIEEAAGRPVPSANAVFRGLRDQKAGARRADILDAVEVLVAGGQLVRDGATLSLL